SPTAAAAPPATPIAEAQPAEPSDPPSPIRISETRAAPLPVPVPAPSETVAIVVSPREGSAARPGLAPPTAAKKTVARPAGSGSAPPPTASGSAHLDVPVIPGAPAQSFRGTPFSRGRAEASLSWCRLPMDPKNPDPALGRAVLDWGRVTRREVVMAMLVDTEHRMMLYEVRGTRGTYRFNGGSHDNTHGTLDVPVGQLVVFCEDALREPSELYALPAAWKGPLNLMTSVLPISAPPKLAAIAKHAPLHIDWITLLRDGTDGKSTLLAGRRYLVYAKVEAVDGTRLDMGKWTIELPASTPGANLAATGKRLWFVFEKPILEATDDPKKPHLVVHALHVQADMFPP
ncbi:MAG: hypothetical protein H0T89_00640, partial [Deltaproteobacteria bacterium]|nr:hypothetical protein [Deltaproteobacteria bacterium]